MFKSLKLRLLFYFFLANVIVLLGFSLFLYSIAQKGVSDILDNQLKMITMDILGDVDAKHHANAKNIADELMDEFEIGALYAKVIYYNKKNNRIDYESVSSEIKSYLFNIPINEMGHKYSIYYFDQDIYRVSSMLVFEDDDLKIFLQLATEKNLHSPFLNHLALSLVISIPIILILFLLIANALLNKTFYSVKKVVDSVHTISSNQLTNRIDTENIPSEIKELVQTFNKLLENIEKAFDSISTFSSNASHELKTPLTVIRGEAEVGLRKERTSSEYKAILEDVVNETIKVQEIIDQLFFLTKKDTTEFSSNFEELYLDEIITDLASEIEKFASTKFIHIKITDIVPVVVYANEVLLRVALNNLLKNAIIYSKDNGEVRISLHEKKSHYILKIADDGCGISSDDLPFVFERFYRADEQNSFQSKGTGLGLAIVKMIFELHKYEIGINSILGKGTQVIITIPKQLDKVD